MTLFVFGSVMPTKIRNMSMEILPIYCPNQSSSSSWLHKNQIKANKCHYLEQRQKTKKTKQCYQNAIYLYFLYSYFAKSKSLEWQVQIKTAKKTYCHCSGIFVLGNELLSNDHWLRARNWHLNTGTAGSFVKWNRK